jgi:hypothetical protein
MSETNTTIHSISYNGEQIAQINIETDEVLDPIMYNTSTIKDYFDGIIEGGDIDEITDPTIIMVILNEDGTKRLGLSAWSRFHFPQLTNEKYNIDKFEKLYFKCNNNVGWAHASNQADIDLGLLMSLRIQFPPMSEGFVRWGDLHNYLMYSNQEKEYSKDGQTHEYYIIPVKQNQSLPGVVSYSFYIHQKVFERNPAYLAYAKSLGIYDEQWNVSASHCQAENNYLYAPIMNDDIVMTDHEVFPVLSEEFVRYVNTNPPEPSESLLTPSEADDIIDALNSDDDDEDSGNVVRNLANVFDEAEDDDESVDRDELDIINIYPNDNSELTEVVELYCNDIDTAVNIYGNPDDWNIVMHNFERREFDFGDYEDDEDDEDDDEDEETTYSEDEREYDRGSNDEERGPPLTMADLASAETEEAPRTPDTQQLLRTPTTPVREPRESSERRLMTIGDFEAMILKNREDWLEGEAINLAQETFKHHRENITIVLNNREELNKAFLVTRDMINQANEDKDQIDDNDMDEEIHPYFIGNTPYKFDWDVSGVEDFSKLGKDFFDTSVLASESIPFTDGQYWPKNLENWDMSSAVDLSEMFKNCTNFQFISLKNWGDKLGNVRDASSMFEGCSEYNDDLSSWNVSSFTMIDNMFKDCFTFEGDLSSWSMPNLISCSEFIREDYPRERHALSLRQAQEVCMEQSVQNAGGIRAGSRIQSEQYCQKGGALDRKIKHLENYVMSKGLYYLPSHIINDAKKIH